MSVSPQGSQVASRGVRRLATETKQAFKTTEFWVFLTVVLAILIAAAVTRAGDSGGDRLVASNAWLYVTIVAAAYLVSRGLAKAGVRDPYWDHPGAAATSDSPITERIKTAAAVIRDGEAPAQDSQPAATKSSPL